jgi:hypothetical protein
MTVMTFKEHSQLDEAFFAPAVWGVIRSVGNWGVKAINSPGAAVGTVGTAVGTAGVGTAKIIATKPVVSTAGIYGTAAYYDMDAVMATTESMVAFVVEFSVEHAIPITIGIAKSILSKLTLAGQLKLGTLMFVLLYIKYGKKIKNIWKKFLTIVQKVKTQGKKLKKIKVNKAAGKKLGKVTLK